MAVQRRVTKTVIVTLVTNCLTAVATIGGFVITGAVALLAVGALSAAGVANQILLLVSDKRARRAATPPHPLSYGRERYFWSFVVAVLSSGLGGALAISAGIVRIRHTNELVSARAALIIVGGALVLKGLSFGRVAVTVKRARAQQSWWPFIRNATQPHLPVVAAQDLGALMGLLLATGAVAGSMATGTPIYDAICAVVVGVLLAAMTTALAIEMKRLLIGETASDTDEQGIAAAIEVEPCVRRLVHLRTQQIGPDELLVGAKIELIDGLDMVEVTEVVGRLEASVRRTVPAARIMYLEPDVFRTTLPRDLDPPPVRAAAAAEP